MRALGWVISLTFMLILAGCGGSAHHAESFTMNPTTPGTGPNPGSPPPPAVPTGTLRIESQLEEPLNRTIRAQMVPSQAEQMRFTGLTADNEAVYGPRTETKAAVIELPDVPVTVVKLQVEYLAQDLVIGVARSEVTVTPNQVTSVPEESFVELEITIASLNLTPPVESRAAGVSLQYKAMGTLTDGTSLDLTALVDWSSSDPSVAQPSPRGMVATLAEGSALITASRNGVSATATLAVTPPTVVGVDVSPASLALPVGSDASLSATLIFTNATRVPSTDVSWSVAQSGIATVSPSGTVTAVAEGSTVVTVASGNFIAQVEVTVLPAEAKLERLSVNLVSVGITVNTGIQLTTTAHYSDGTELAANRLVTWTSSRPDVASVQPNGYLYGAAVGTTTLTAELDGLTLTIPVTVIPEPPQRTTFTIDPGELHLHLNVTIPLYAVIGYSDGTATSPSDVAWTSSNPSVATVDSSGQLVTVGVGSAQVSARFDGMQATANVTVAPKLVSLEITPASASTPLRVPYQFTLIGRYEDGSSAPLTAQAFWSSSDTDIAYADRGLTSTHAMGNVTITAQFHGLTTTANLEVIDGVLLGLVLFPSDVGSLHENGTAPLELYGNYSHIPLTQLTEGATWESSDPEVLTVSATGVVTAVYGAGGRSATITAHYSGFSVSQTIAVALPTPVGLNLNVSAISMASDAEGVQATAYLLMSNGDLVPVTDEALWSSSNAEVFVVPTFPQDNPGYVIPTGIGTATLTVSHSGFQLSIPIYVQ